MQLMITCFLMTKIKFTVINNRLQNLLDLNRFFRLKFVKFSNEIDALEQKLVNLRINHAKLEVLLNKINNIFNPTLLFTISNLFANSVILLYFFIFSLFFRYDKFSLFHALSTMIRFVHLVSKLFILIWMCASTTKEVSLKLVWNLFHKII